LSGGQVPFTLGTEIGKLFWAFLFAVFLYCGENPELLNFIFSKSDHFSFVVLMSSSVNSACAVEDFGEIDQASSAMNDSPEGIMIHPSFTVLGAGVEEQAGIGATRRLFNLSITRLLNLHVYLLLDLLVYLPLDLLVNLLATIFSAVWSTMFSAFFSNILSINSPTIFSAISSIVFFTLASTFSPTIVSSSFSTIL